nr:hypothetical protein [Micromonospora sp. DSM 115978]
MTEPDAVATSSAQRSTRDKVVALVTVPAWYALLYLAFVGLVGWQARTGVDGWEDLIMLIAIVYGALAFVLNSVIGMAIMAIRMRSAQWKAGPILSGTVAAAIGLVGCGVIALALRLPGLMPGT